MPLTDRQARFVDAYLLDPNAKNAAIAAGYSDKGAKQAGSRLLTHPAVAAELEARRQKAPQHAPVVTLDKVMAELARIGFSDIRKAVRWASNLTVLGVDPDTDEPALRTYHEVVLVDSKELDDATAAAIAEISQSEKGLKIRFHSKLVALTKLAQILSEDKPPPNPPAAADDDGWGGLLN